MPTAMKKRKLMGEINVVPYIDVMLVLLVIFMVTAPLLTQGIEVELPKANAEPIESVPDHDPLVLEQVVARRHVARTGGLGLKFLQKAAGEHPAKRDTDEQEHDPRCGSEATSLVEA